MEDRVRERIVETFVSKKGLRTEITVSGSRIYFNKEYKGNRFTNFSLLENMFTEYEFKGERGINFRGWHIGCFGIESFEDLDSLIIYLVDNNILLFGDSDKMDNMFKNGFTDTEGKHIEVYKLL